LDDDVGHRKVPLRSVDVVVTKSDQWPAVYRNRPIARIASRQPPSHEFEISPVAVLVVFGEIYRRLE
jgi:hypothetical protein